MARRAGGRRRQRRKGSPRPFGLTGLGRRSPEAAGGARRYRASSGARAWLAASLP